jgi:hypothetical protein
MVSCLYFGPSLPLGLLLGAPGMKMAEAEKFMKIFDKTV